MTTIEDLVARFSGLPAATGGRWSVSPLVERRVYLSRDESGRFAVFVLGEENSFGSYPKISGVAHSTGVIPVPGGEPFSALRLTSSSVAHGNRIMAHISYEFERRLAADPALGNSVLIAEVAWILELLAEQESILSPEEQRGLVGELALLRRLLVLSRELGMPAREPLLRWWGYDRAKRDFAATSVAIEVKTTSREKREHYIGSVDQLDPQVSEEVFVYSVGVRCDPTAARKLPAFIKDVEGVITRSDGSPDEDALATFRKAVCAYGYDASKEKLYNSGPGFMNFHLPPKLFRERDLDRLRLSSFKGEQLPSMVRGVMYTLEIRSAELSPLQERAALVQLLESPATTG